MFTTSALVDIESGDGARYWRLIDGIFGVIAAIKSPCGCRGYEGVGSPSLPPLSKCRVVTGARCKRIVLPKAAVTAFESDVQSDLQGLI